MAYSLFDVIQLTVDMPEENLLAGMFGTIVHIFEKPQITYEVEFCDDDGQTIAQLTLTAEQLLVTATPWVSK